MCSESISVSNRDSNILSKIKHILIALSETTLRYVGLRRLANRSLFQDIHSCLVPLQRVVLRRLQK